MIKRIFSIQTLVYRNGKEKLAMDSTKKLNHSFAALGWGALLIWWGVVMIVDPITIGIGAIGSGLIFLGINLARRLKGVPIRDSTTTVGLMALAWGAVVQAFGLHFWASFAVLLIIFGMAEILSLLARPKAG
jgi:hypothetical protein